MINEVDEALRNMFRNEILSGTDVDVVFDAPTREWASRRNKPTLDLYLYDIREDLRRHETGIIEERDERGRVISRRLPPRFFKLAYLVTAWTQRPEDEHRLLAVTLATAIRYNSMPEEYLTRLLVDNDVNLLMQVAYPPPEDRQVSDVWSSLGGDLKPSIDLQITMPILPDALFDLAAAVMEPLKVDAHGYNTSDAVDETKQLRHAEANGAPT
jgi:hypothetical protein